MKKAALFAIFLFAGIAFNYAQTKKKGSKSKSEVFIYDNESCSGNKGYFDPEKYSKTQIEGAYHLFTGNFLITGPHFFNLETLAEVRENWEEYSDDLEKDYREKMALFKKVSAVPNTSYWIELKKVIAEELQEDYEYEQFRLQVFRDTDILKKRQAPPPCKKYADAILTKDENKKLAVWKALALEQSRNNADPENVMREYEILSKSEQKDDYAFLYLFNFGYNNCSNSGNERRIGNRRDEDYQQFESLFEKIITGDCDEP